jgi:hypothetical protein
VCVIDFADHWPRMIRPSGQLAMLSRLTGAYQSEKASQEQVSDKAAAGVTALAKLVQIVGKDCGTQVKAAAAGYRQLACIHRRIAHPARFLLFMCSQYRSNTTCYMHCVAGACAGSQELGCSFR